MGILKKAAVGSILLGLGAVAVAKNKKPINQFLKTMEKGAKARAKSASKIAKSVGKKAKAKTR